MGLTCIYVHYDEHGLAAVEQYSRRVAGLSHHVQGLDGVRGSVVLSTCNRVEIYVDGECLPQVVDSIQEYVDSDVAPHVLDDELVVLDHLFTVAAGLDSLVLGEREVAGQLRRALVSAQEAGPVGYRLTESVERALSTSRKVAQIPGLASAGRSIVNVALDLADVSCGPVVLLGTGSYAGASAVALRDRGIDDVWVYSASGRGADFAERHQLQLLEHADLPAKLRQARAVVACRGLGQPVLTRADVEAPVAQRGDVDLDILDLALAADVDRAVADVDGVRLWTLESIRGHVPALADGAVEQANAVVARGVAELRDILAGRVMDPAMIALQNAIMAMVDDEVSRLPQRVLDRDEAAHAMRRLAARLIHQPRVRARQAAKDGRANEYLAGLAAVHGITPPEVVDPSTLEKDVCPVTGLRLDDLGESERQATA